MRQVWYPAMPSEGDPDDNVWGDLIAAEFADMGEDAVLVGHSAGAATLCVFLATSNLDLRIAGIFLMSASFYVCRTLIDGDAGREVVSLHDVLNACLDLWSGLRKTSRSQGGKWNAVIRRYIVTIPSMGKTSGTLEQIIST